MFGFSKKKTDDKVPSGGQTIDLNEIERIVSAKKGIKVTYKDEECIAFSYNELVEMEVLDRGEMYILSGGVLEPLDESKRMEMSDGEYKSMISSTPVCFKLTPAKTLMSVYWGWLKNIPPGASYIDNILYLTDELAMESFLVWKFRSG